MSGHNKWSQIKHRKGAQDAKRSALFSKILGAISIAAKSDPSPETNPRLRTLVEKAKAASVPGDNIERAISRAKEQKDMKEFVFECIGPAGIPVLVEGLSDNTNRTMQQMRVIAGESGGKPADPGSLLWAFELVDETLEGVPTRHYRAKFPQPVDEQTQNALAELASAFEESADVLRVATAALPQS